MTIWDAVRDPAIFGSCFTGASWQAWGVFLKALFGVALIPQEQGLYRRHTGRQTLPTEPAREAWVVVGRRGGKSRIAALVAVFLACFLEYRRLLAPGERGMVMVIAADRPQARTVFRYIAGLLDSISLLVPMVESRTREAIHLSNRVTIKVHTANFRTVRGYTVIAAICDEIAFWRSEESANPDTEILNGLRPGMATVPSPLLLCISSPYARRGALWQAYRQHYGQDGDPVLVWQADTRSMNPTVSESVIAKAYAEDEATASAEYGAQFRRDIDSFLAREAIESAVVPGRRELPALDEHDYTAFVDPSGGSQDSMTLAIAHQEDGRAVLDLLRERRPPFSPEAVVQEFSHVLRDYRVTTVTGDRYGGEWPRERFCQYGIGYEIFDKAKSDLYRELLPMINSGRVDLLEHPRLVAQLSRLERRTGRGGRDSIDHAPGDHDDLANAVAGALVGTETDSRVGIEIW